MTKLNMGSSLADINETQGFEAPADLDGFEDGERTHWSANRDVLRPEEFRLDERLAIFEEHFHNFTEVGPQLVQGFCLGVRPGKTGHVADE
jgi:hypothetical protein